jgi:hypothetical protein
MAHLEAPAVGCDQGIGRVVDQGKLKEDKILNGGD